MQADRLGLYAGVASFNKSQAIKYSSNAFNDTITEDASDTNEFPRK